MSRSSARAPSDKATHHPMDLAVHGVSQVPPPRHQRSQQHHSAASTEQTRRLASYGGTNPVTRSMRRVNPPGRDAQEARRQHQLRHGNDANSNRRRQEKGQSETASVYDHKLVEPPALRQPNPRGVRRFLEGPAVGRLTPRSPRGNTSLASIASTWGPCSSWTCRCREPCHTV